MQHIVSSAQQTAPAPEQMEAGIKAVKIRLLHFAGVVPESEAQSGNFRFLRQFTQGIPTDTFLFYPQFYTDLSWD